MLDDQRPMDRRKFFRAGLRELLRPLSSAVRPLEAVANQIGKLDPPPAEAAVVIPQLKPNTPEQEHWLRPPGALDEADFASTCSKCGECVRVCPSMCIQIDTTGHRGGGVPYIDPDQSSCILCEGLLCMNSCPTGALTPIPLEKIDMGKAVWHESRCLRTVGQDCTMCIDHCPVGTAAIDLNGGRVVVYEAACTGCGACQHECPTTPKSIIVEPKSQRPKVEPAVV